MGKRTYILFFFILIRHASATTVPTVIVTADKHISHTSTGGSRTTITHQQLANTGTSSLAGALQSLGGVQLQDMSGNGSQVSLGMRGFGANASSNTLLLINGIPITNPDMAPPDLNAIPLHNIEAIEIISGSESVAYGDQAVGGVINILTKQPQKEKYQIACNGGSYSQHNCYFVSHHKFNLSDINIRLGNTHTNNYREHNDYDQQIISGNVAHQYPTGTLKIIFTVANENMQYPGSLTATQVRQNRRQANNGIDYFKNINGNIHLQHEQELSPNWQLVSDISHRKMQGHGVLFSPFTQSRSVSFIKPKLKGTILSTLVTNGVDLQYDTYQLNSTYGPTDNNEQQYSLYTLIKKEINPRYSISVGARGGLQNSTLHTSTSSNNINRAVATTIGGIYKLTNDVDIYLRRAGSFRFPKADENASTTTSIQGLRTQRGISYETGIQAEDENNSFNISIYQLNLRDEIAFDPTQTQQQPFGSNRNLPPTTRKGFTLAGKKYLPIIKNVSIDGQYNYVNARFHNGSNSGNFIPLVSENIFHAGINYSFSTFWNIYSEAIFTGKQYAANDDANIAGSIGGYTLFNFNVGYHPKNFSADLRINNIFNKNYYLYTVYQTSIATEYFYPAPDRNVIVTLKYIFE